MGELWGMGRGRAWTRVMLRVFALAVCAVCLCRAAVAVEKGFTVFHGDREQPRVAITVDDCYRADCVRDILDLCAENGVPVTFFVVGRALRTEDQALWREALDLGCELGNHTWGHSRLPNLRRDVIRDSLSRTEARMSEVLGFDYRMRVMRPPYGQLSNKEGVASEVWVVETIAQAGYAHAVRWDVSQTDAKKALRQTENGSILLYHANPKDVRCLKELLPALAEAGFACVTVSELLGVGEEEDTSGGSDDSDGAGGGSDGAGGDSDGADGAINPADPADSVSPPTAADSADDYTRWIVSEE